MVQYLVQQGIASARSTNVKVFEVIDVRQSLPVKNSGHFGDIGHQPEEWCDSS
jgi:hypothetical protein